MQKVKDDFSYEITFVEVLTSKTHFSNCLIVWKKKTDIVKIRPGDHLHSGPTCCRCALKLLLCEEKKMTELDIKKNEEKYDVNTKPKSDLIAGKNFTLNSYEGGNNYKCG